MQNRFLCFLLLLSGCLTAAAQQTRVLYLSGTGADDTRTWQFRISDGAGSGRWSTIEVPSQWELQGFGEYNYGRMGAPGKMPLDEYGEYRYNFRVPAAWRGQDVRIVFEGAMTDTEVRINGRSAGPVHQGGFYRFSYDVTGLLKYGGTNKLEVTVRKESANASVNNAERHADWWNFGGIYRPVYLTATAPEHIAHWAVDARADGSMTVDLETEQAPEGASVCYSLRPLTAPAGSFSSITRPLAARHALQWDGVAPWECEHPCLYVLKLELLSPAGKVLHEVTQRVGFRTVDFRPQDGLYVNDVKVVLKGVNRHVFHPESGRCSSPAISRSDAALVKEMNMNAIRSHYPPDTHFLDACDSLGIFYLDELAGWHGRYDDEVGPGLVEEMVKRDVNHPCVILWSIGNECGEQGLSDKWDIPRRLTEICHREDPTRPTTAGNDNLWAASQPYAGTIDVYGFNYKPHAYAAFRDAHPGQPFLGSETASCISTRGYYRFPVSEEKGEGWTLEAPFQVSSYDLYAPGWASCPDYEWSFEDEVPECAGEFVWTGFDYLGEPTPFNLDPSVLTNFHTEEEKEAYKAMIASWGQAISEVPLPSRSSYFGIIDLAGFPKDRYWLYQARWREDLPMAHILPHWTWPGREGQVTPVHVYSSGDEAELFLNGVSQGVRTRGPREYRFRWDGVVYEPGTLKVVVRKDGRPWAEDEVRTAGKAVRMAVEPERIPGGGDLVFVDIDLLDRAGTLVPDADNLLTFSVKGPVEIVAADAGDPTSHVPFYSHKLPAFHGKASVILRRTGKGPAALTVASPGLKKQKIHLPE